MREEKKTALMPEDAGIEFEGIAIASVEEGRVTAIDGLPQDYAKSMVEKGRLPASVYDAAQLFRDDDYEQGLSGSQYLGDESRSTIYSHWRDLAGKMEDGDGGIHVGICSEGLFTYWAGE